MFFITSLQDTWEDVQRELPFQNGLLSCYRFGPSTESPILGVWNKSECSKMYVSTHTHTRIHTHTQRYVKTTYTSKCTGGGVGSICRQGSRASGKHDGKIAVGQREGSRDWRPLATRQEVEILKQKNSYKIFTLYIHLFIIIYCK